MKVTIVITKDHDERPGAFLKEAQKLWESARNLKETQYPIECHVQIYGQTLRYDQNSDPTENAVMLYESMPQAAVG